MFVMSPTNERKNRSNLVGEICLLFQHFTLRETHLLKFNHIHNLLELQGESENFDSFRGLLHDREIWAILEIQYEGMWCMQGN